MAPGATSSKMTRLTKPWTSNLWTHWSRI